MILCPPRGTRSTPCSTGRGNRFLSLLICGRPFSPDWNRQSNRRGDPAMGGPEMAFRKIGVLGCGLMGSRIAQVSAAAGYEVWVREIEQRFLDKGFDALKKSMSREVEKGKLKSEDMENTLARLHGTLNLEDLRDCGLIIEAIVEDIQVKRDLFSTLDRLCVPETILASNTSSLTVIEMAAATQRADRIVGLHFFNPAHVMKLV